MNSSENEGHRLDRREFLVSAAATGKLVAARTPAVAAIITEYRSLSHADVIAGRILNGYSPDGVKVKPRTRIVSMYTDQVPENDMSRGLATKHGFHIYPSVREALTLGGARLAVDAVLLVGEHGNYASNSRGQKMYPRYELFRQVVEVFRESGRSTPVFCDKHLSYSWEKASQMYRWARELRVPFMAGSSIPVTIREPELEIPAGSRIRHAVSVGYGDLDAYGFHTLEGLQCMVERRRGGETGIAAVEWLEKDAVWKWRDGEGRWSAPLLDAALATGGRVKPGPPEQNAKRPALFLLEYKDGLRTASYLLDGHVSEFEFAAELDDRPEPAATQFVLAGARRPLPHFDGLVKCIEDLFVTGRPVYPVERTLLTTGALAFLFESRERQSRVATPELNISYRSPEHIYFERG